MIPSRKMYFTKPYSEETGKMIDEEVRKLIDQGYERTKKLLTERKKEVEILAKELLKREVLFQSDVEQLIGKRPYEDKKAHIALDSSDPTIPPVDDNEEGQRSGPGVPLENAAKI